MTRAVLSARLPGLRFEVVQPQRPDVLPRMDITAFVGFSASGPLHVPVLVEDMAQFDAVFGGGLPDDLPLAWDVERGEQVYAYLAPALRSFFRNGGRRAWVIRVAGEAAHTAWFPVPGLVRFDGDTLLPAFAPARSPGAWADALQLGTTLLSQTVEALPFKTTPFDPVAKTLDLFLKKSDQVVVGDMLRLTCRNRGLVFFPVSRLDSLESTSIAPSTGSVPGMRRVRVLAEKLFWLRPTDQSLPSGIEASLIAYNHKGKIGVLPARRPETLIDTPDSPGNAEAPFILNVTGPVSETFKAACAPGALVRVDFPNYDPLWMLVDTCTSVTDDPGLRLLGQGVWQMDTPADSADWASPDLIERLTFELWVRQPGQALRRQSELGFMASQPRFWAALPNDQQLFSAQALATTGDSSFGLQTDMQRASLWQSAQVPRFPLAGPSESSDIFLPFIMATMPKVYARPDEPLGDPLVSNGLDRFSAALFLDPALADAGVESLLDRANSLRYTNPITRPLRGIHAALSIDEVTLIAVPDAAQRAWFKPSTLVQSMPQSLPPLTRPEWWHFLPCDSPEKVPQTPEPKWGEFLPCEISLVPAPILSATHPDVSGSFKLTWLLPSSDWKTDSFSYILEESSFVDFSDAHQVYQGNENHYDILGYSQGEYYYRVRVELERLAGGVNWSDWSNGCGVLIAAGATWQATRQEEYQSDTLRAVQLNLLRMCAARGDMFAVLSIPSHFREKESIDYALALRSPFSDAIPVDMPVLQSPDATVTVSVAALGYGEDRGLSFGALYHPWLYSTENGSNIARLNPPDGFAAGILAQRAYERGTWVAPANQAMRGVVALGPLISPACWLDIQQARINLIRQEPQGFLVLSESTLSDDPDWTLINVRRLISLVRRLAQRYGPMWVFEPNDDAFARLVKRTFVPIFDQMFARGAFAGVTPETAYRVDVWATAKDIDEGRFIVELRVAPSLPMRFITIQLVQSGERSLVTEGG